PVLPPLTCTLFPSTTLFRSRTERTMVAPGGVVWHVLAAADHVVGLRRRAVTRVRAGRFLVAAGARASVAQPPDARRFAARLSARSEEHTSELQSRENLVCRL